MKYELLSPAGDSRAVAAAVHGGADAVYIGGKNFGARAFARNFSYEELREAVRFAHTFGVKVYVTVNTLVFESETEAFLAHVEQVCRAGADALIMQDVGMITAVRRRFPDAVIHASTQMHNHSDAALAFVRNLGASRAVLAREMSLEQIQSLQTDIEKEAFIHGALCICYSGQCLFSALVNGRSGNRGMCAQSCRMRYRLRDEEGKRYDTNGAYLLSPKDIGLFEDIAPLLEAGVTCLKIEGRMKSPAYVGLATRIYAGLLADWKAGRKPRANAAELNDLGKLFNRGYTKGHLFDAAGEALMSKDRPNHRGTPLGRVTAVGRGRIALRLCAPLRQGDGVKFERADEGFICNKLYKNGLLIAAAQAGETVELDAKAAVRVGDTVVKTTDTELEKRLARMPERRVSITARLTARIGHPLRLVFCDADGHIAQADGEVVQQSRTRPVTPDELRAGVAKLGETPYALKKMDIDADRDIFVAKSALNALRREAAERLTKARTKVPPLRICHSAAPAIHHSESPHRPMLHVLVRNAAQLGAVEGLVTGDIYTDDKQLYFAHKRRCPALRLRTDRLADVPEPYEGERLLVTDHGGLHAYADGNDITLDHSVYAVNAAAVAFFVSQGARRVTLAAELNEARAADMVAAYKHANGQLPPLEAVLYARHELMAMRHCVLRGALGEAACALCRQKRFYLEDVKGTLFPVATGEGCKSRIFSARVAQTQAQAYLSMGVRHFRVELFDEDAAQSARIIKRYLETIGEWR